jgi:hypothetical protein
MIKHYLLPKHYCSVWNNTFNPSLVANGGAYTDKMVLVDSGELKIWWQTRLYHISGMRGLLLNWLMDGNLKTMILLK